LWGPLVVAAGASLLIVHLGRNRRLFFTACLNPRSSWLARGFLILAGFIVVGLTCLALAVFAPAWAAEGGATWRTLQALGAASAIATAVYTGLLLRSMQHIPAWRTVLVPFLFLVSALSCGSAALALTVIVHGLVTGVDGLNEATLHALSSVEQAVLPLEMIVLAVYVHVLQHGLPEARLSARMLLRGEQRVVFWVLVVSAGLVLPFGLEIAYAFAPHAVAVTAVAALGVLSGGLALRHLVLAVGIKEKPPQYRRSEWRRRRPLPTSAGRFDGVGERP
jgi:formate-dependent nitrite reductase membrane component NrfD